MSEMIISNNLIPAASLGNDIVFISDLHFDFTEGKFKAEAAPQMEDDFISFVKEHCSNNILCVCGDFYSSHKKALSFIKRLEENQIKGFFVLGNHDYWNNGRMSHTDIINLFSIETQDHEFFKFLVTGRKYYYKDICVIGDTGWTSFRRGKRRVDLKQFTNFPYSYLPDLLKVKDFNPKSIIALHKEWVSFANEMLKTEDKVLIVTHFPMVDFTKKDWDCWWSSTTQLEGDNSWRLFGHSHRPIRNGLPYRQYNNASLPRGYGNAGIEKLKRRACEKQYASECNADDRKNFEYIEKMKAYVEANWQNAVYENQYNSYSFGKLEKVIESSDIVATNELESIAVFYNPALVSNDSQDLAVISNIKRRGYKRCSSNKHNFAALAKNPVEYIERVKEVTAWYLRNSYIGYDLSGSISNQTIESIYYSIATLESGNTSDVRAFVIAAVITGYAFNNMLYLIEGMRPLDDYDIMRFWLMFLTIKKFEIDMKNICSVLSDKSKPIQFGNIEMYLPLVNDQSLNVNEVEALSQKTRLLSLPT